MTVRYGGSEAEVSPFKRLTQRHRDSEFTEEVSVSSVFSVSLW